MNERVVIVLCMVMSSAFAYILDPGPVVVASKGQIWPHPKTQISSERFFTVRPSTFNFESIGETCDTLQLALDRYGKIITDQLRRYRHRAGGFNDSSKWRNTPNFMGQIDVLKVNLKNTCQRLPYLGMDESYQIEIKESGTTLESTSIWGMLRGLESFSQLLHISPDAKSLMINETTINDEPRFSHRGLLVDTSRHFIAMNTIGLILDGMAYNKLNVFHWHIVDDHSFPYQSLTFPELTQGAFHPSMIYSQEDVAQVIEMARVRGIRVMVEFDTPGHTRSWGVSHPEILTQCGIPYLGKMGPIDPSNDETYEFMYKLIEEIVEVFPDRYQHLGGDEVGFECWESNDNISSFMSNMNITSYTDLEEYYIQKIIDKISSLNASSVVWQEVYTNGCRLPKGTVVHIWTGDRRKLLNKVTQDKLPALLSTCWYLDHLSTGGDWLKFYNCDPHDFPGTPQQKKLVMGGEACMWSETVDDSNILQRIFPRVCASAEKLWSDYSVNDIEDAKKRIEEQYCRLRSRNIPAQPPNGPGFCI